MPYSSVLNVLQGMLGTQADEPEDVSSDAALFDSFLQEQAPAEPGNVVDNLGIVKGIKKIPANIQSYYETSKGTGQQVNATEQLNEAMSTVNAIRNVNGFDEKGMLNEKGGETIMTGGKLAFTPFAQRLLNGESVDEVLSSTKATIQEQLADARNNILKGAIHKPEQSEAMKNLFATEGTTDFGEFSDVMTSAEALTDLFAESAIPSAIIMAAAAGGGSVGATKGPVGAILGASTGAAIASFSVEKKMALMDNLIEEGVDVFNVEELSKFLTEHPDKMKTAVRKANLRAGGVAALDAAAIGLGGAILKKVMDTAGAAVLAGKPLSTATTAAGLTAAGVAEVGLQGTLGAAGELTGSVLAGEEIDPDAMVAEFAGEFGPGGIGDATVGFKTKALGEIWERLRLDQASEEAKAADADAMLDVRESLQEEIDLDKDNFFSDLEDEQESDLQEASEQEFEEQPALTAKELIRNSIADAKAKVEAKKDTSLEAQIEAGLSEEDAGIATEASEAAKTVADETTALKKKAQTVLTNADAKRASDEEFAKPLRDTETPETVPLNDVSPAVSVGNAVEDATETEAKYAEQVASIDAAMNTLQIGRKAKGTTPTRVRKHLTVSERDLNGDFTLIHQDINPDGTKGKGSRIYLWNPDTQEVVLVDTTAKDSGRKTTEGSGKLPAYIMKGLNAAYKIATEGEQASTFNTQSVRADASLALSLEDHIQLETALAEESQRAVARSASAYNRAETLAEEAEARLRKLTVDSSTTGEPKEGVSREALRTAINEFFEAYRARDRARAIYDRDSRKMRLVPDAVADAKAAQARAEELYKEASRTTVKGENPEDANLTEGAEVTDISKMMPVLPGEENVKIKTYTTPAELAGLKAQTTLVAGATQILPNGRMRTVRIRPSDTGKVYTATVEGVGGAKLKEPIVMGDLPIKADPDKIAQAAEAVEQEQATRINEARSETGLERPVGRKYKAKRQSDGKTIYQLDRGKVEQTSRTSSATSTAVGDRLSEIGEIRKGAIEELEGLENELDTITTERRDAINQRRRMEKNEDFTSPAYKEVNKTIQELDPVKTALEAEVKEAKNRIKELGVRLTGVSGQANKAEADTGTILSRIVDKESIEEFGSEGKIPFVPKEELPFRQNTSYQRMSAYASDEAAKAAAEEAKQGQRNKELGEKARKQRLAEEKKAYKEESKLIADMFAKNGDVEAGIARIGGMEAAELEDRFTIPQMKRMAKAVNAPAPRNKSLLAGSIREVLGLAEHEALIRDRVNALQLAREANTAARAAGSFKPTTDIDNYADTPDGKAMFALAYMTEIRNHLLDEGFSNSTADAVMNDILSEHPDPAARRAYGTMYKHLFSTQQIDQTGRPLTEKLERFEAVAKARQEKERIGSRLSALVARWTGGAVGTAPKAINKVTEQMSEKEFARTPAFLEEGAEQTRRVSDDRAELEALRLQEADRNIGRGVDRTEGTLTLPPRQREQTEEERLRDLEDFREDERDERLLLGREVDRLFETVGVKAEALPAIDVEPTPEDINVIEPTPLEDVVPEDEPLLTEEENTAGETIIDQDTPVEEEAPSVADEVEELTAPAAEKKEKAKKKKSKKAKNENTVVNLKDLGDDRRVVQFMSPIQESSNPWHRLGRRLRAAGLYTTSSFSTLPKDMRSARDILTASKGRVSAALNTMRRFGEKLQLTLAEEGVLDDAVQHENMNRAIVARIEGMRPQSVRLAFGVTPSPAVEALLQEYIPAKRALQEELRQSDSVDVELKTIIKKNGDTYLKKSLQQTPAIVAILRGKKSVTQRMSLEQRDALNKAAIVAFGLPESTEDYNNLPIDWLKGLIGPGRPFPGVADKAKGAGRTIETYLLDKNGEVKTDKEGKPVLGDVRVKKATKGQVVSFLQRNTWDERAITNYINHVVDSILDPPASSGRKNASVTQGDSTITSARSLMLSQRQQIERMLRLIRKSEGISPELKKGLKDATEGLREMNRKEFVEQVSELDPSLKSLLQRTDAEYDMWDVVRGALDEVTDPAFLMQDSAMRVASEVELSKSMNAIVTLGLESGRLSINKSDIDEGVHTHKLSLKYNWFPGRNNVPIPAIGDIQFVQYTKDGVKAQFQGKDIYGDKDTIKAIQDLMGARASAEHMAGTEFLYRLSALAKYDKVVLNPFAHLRNMAGTTYIAMSRGIIGARVNPFTRVITEREDVGTGSLMTGLRLAEAEARASLPAGSRGKAAAAKHFMKRPQLEQLAHELSIRNVTHDSVHQGAMADLFTHLQALSDEDSSKMFASGTVVGHREAGASLDSKLSRWTEFANEMFRLEDEAMKGVAFLQRTKQFLVIQGTGDLRGDKKHSVDLVREYLDPSKRDLMSSEDQRLVSEAMDMAAENVLQTFPTFSRAPQFIKSLSRNPIMGAFPTFQAEMVRNHINHLLFGIDMAFGKTNPDGSSIPEDQQARRRKLGTGLLLQQGAYLSAGTIGTGMLNIAMRQGEGQDDDTPVDRVKMASKALVQSATEPLNTYNNYEFRNLLPSWYNNTAMVLVPGTVNSQEGTFTWINAGWSSPEGALIEAGYGVANDIAKVMGLPDVTDEFKEEVILEIVRSAASHLLGVFGNDEVLLRDLISFYNEPTGVTSENLRGLRKTAGRNINQMVRELINPDDNPLFNPTGEQGSVVPDIGAALLAATATNFPGITAGTQIAEAGRDTWDARHLINDPNKLAATITAKAIAGAWGIKYETFDFKEDYPKTLRFTHMKNFTNSSTRMATVLLDPSRDWSASEFETMYNTLDKYRKQNYDNITAATQFGSRRMGVDTAEMRAVFEEASGGRGFEDLEGHTLSDIENGRYWPLGYIDNTGIGKISTARMTEVENVWRTAADKGDRPSASLGTRLTWMSTLAAGGSIQ